LADLGHAHLPEQAALGSVGRAHVDDDDADLRARPGYGAVHVVVGAATVVLLESLDGRDPAVVTDDDDWLVA